MRDDDADDARRDGEPTAWERGIMGRLDGKVAIVTGGGGGIGSATARKLAAEGAAVTVADVDGDRAAAVAESVRAQGGEALHCAVDVAAEDQVREMIDTTVRTFGGIDLLHNNAAAVSPDVVGADVAVHEADMSVWERSFAVNVFGPAMGCKYAIPHMLERGGGSIVNTSSDASLAAEPTRPAYGASKSALNALTRNIATAYGKRGIRCNAVAPGFILTEALQAVLPPAFLTAMEGFHMAPRLGAPEDIANMVAFLASDESVFVNGQVLSVDGGLLCHFPLVEL